MIRLGPFELEVPFGQGGMGAVWRGQHVSQGVPVAVKVITAERVRTPRYLRAFRREVQTMASLSHPCIITVLDYGEVSLEASLASDGQLTAGSPYLVMELADGGTLFDLYTTLTWPTLCNILLDVLDALGHAHARGVVHRDLKPDNVLLFNQPDAAPLLKLTDFGLAHAIDGRGARDVVGTTAGTPEYMAPEQLMGEWREYGPWTDLYALGCMTYQLCSGRLPFESNGLQQLMREHVYRPPPPLEPRIEVPEGLQPWLFRLLAKDPRDRFQWAADAAWSLLELPEELSMIYPAVSLDAAVVEPAGDTPRFEEMALHQHEAVANDSQPLTPALTEPAAVHDVVPSTDVYDVVSAGEVRVVAATHASPTLATPSLDMGIVKVPPTQVSASMTPALSQLPKRSVTRVSGPNTPPVLIQHVSLDLNDEVWAIAHRPDMPTVPRDNDPPTMVDMPVMTPAGLSSSIVAALLSPGDMAPVKVPPLPVTWQRPEPERAFKLIGAGLDLFGVQPIPMVNRVEERDVMWHALRDVIKDKRAQALLLAGASGTGKSRLAEWIAERAHEVGAAIILRASHDSTERPASGLPQMLADHFRCVGLGRPRMLQRVQQVLAHYGVVGDDYDAQILTETMAPCGTWLSDDAPQPALAAGVGTRHVVIRRLFEQMARTRPVLVWVDDVQWASDALRFVDHVLAFQKISPSPVLFFLTVNEDQLVRRPIEARLLREIQRRAGASRLDIGPLAEVDHAALIKRLLRLEGDLIDEVADRTAGNPLFAVQLVGDWVDRGVLVPGPTGFQLCSGGAARSPDDIHVLWRTRQADFVQRFFLAERDAATLALEVAAALGRDVDVAEWMATCRRSGLEAPSRFVSQLVAAQLARRSAQGWSFVHGMLCESIGRSAQEAGRWRGHHVLCAEMLSERYVRHHVGVAARLARHWLEAGRVEQALDPLLLAAEHALSVSDFERASMLLEQRLGALRALQAPDEDPRWAETWMCQAGILTTQGRLDEAHVFVDRADAVATHHPLLEAEVRRVRGMIAQQRGDSATGIDHLEQALQHYHRLGLTTGVAHCLQGLGTLYQVRGELDTATERFEEAVGIFEAEGDLDGVGMCLSGMAENCRQSGDTERATELIRRAMEHLERSGNRLGVASCLNDLGDIARAGGDLPRAATLYRRALRQMDALGSRESVVPRNNLGLLLLAGERYDAAQHIFERVLTELEDADRPGYQGVVHVEMLPCLAVSRDWSRWDHHYLEGSKLLNEHAQVSDDVAWSAQRAGELAFDAGDRVRASLAFELALAQWQRLNRVDDEDVVYQALSALREDGEGE